MGLDITAYSHLKHVGKHAKDPALNEGEPGGVDDWCYYDNHVQGCYEVTDETVTHGFCAGSYGGYNRWRQNLQDQFNPSREPNGPFYELIWFADNEWLATVFDQQAEGFLTAARTVGVTVEEIEGGGDTESYRLLVGEPGTGWQDSDGQAAKESNGG